MQFSLTALALVALSMDCAFAQPAKHLHKHMHRRDLADLIRKRQNWNDPALYAGVNWADVDYNGNPSPQPTPTPAPASAPAPAPAKPEPAVASQPPPAPVAAQVKVAKSTSTGGKRGLAYNPTSPDLSIFEGFGSQITWGYNWDSAPAGLPSQFQYVPTLFSTLSVHTTQWAANVQAATSGSGPFYLMSFNEPDQPLPQADMSPGTAVAAWQQYMAPYASDNVKLGSPSVSNGVGTNSATGQPMGLAWLTAFLEQCSGCDISFVPVHWYGCGGGCDVQNDISAFKTDIGSAITAAGGKPVWVTEFGTNSGDPTTFMNEVLPWLDNEPGVERYAYFMVEDGVLTSGDSLSSLGSLYGTTS